MSRGSLLNGLALTTALVLSVAMAGGRRRRPAEAIAPGAEGPSELVDATGQRVGVRGYERIVSASTVVDRVLLEVCDPAHVRAVTTASAEGTLARRYRGFATIDSLDRLETIVALEPDLVLAHNVADVRRVERLREAGLTVFDLGALRGRASLSDDIRQISMLCGEPEDGARYARTLERRLDSLAGTAGERPSALYVSVYADRFYGGARETSYHDVLEAAGLSDAAGDRVGWPQYTVEELLGLDPARIVTREGMRSTFCDHPVLGRLRACPDHVIELPADLLDDPGPGMLEAAEALFDATH